MRQRLVRWNHREFILARRLLLIVAHRGRRQRIRARFLTTVKGLDIDSGEFGYLWILVNTLWVEESIGLTTRSVVRISHLGPMNAGHFLSCV